MQSLSTVASKNVALRMDVVRKLDRAKRPGESYSDVIDRQFEDRPSLLELIKYLRENPVDDDGELDNLVREIRREGNRSSKRRWKRLEKMF